MTRLERYNRNKLVYADSKKGLTRKELAAKYGMTTRYVDKICTHEGAYTQRPAPASRAKPRRAWHVTIPQRIKALRVDGFSPAKIAGLLGLDEDIVEEILRREEA